jgi:hypothetical protein
MAEHAVGTVKGALTADGIALNTSQRRHGLRSDGPEFLSKESNRWRLRLLAPRVTVGAHVLELPAQQFRYLTPTRRSAPRAPIHAVPRPCTIGFKKCGAMRLEDRVPFDRAGFGTPMRDFVGNLPCAPAHLRWTRAARG